MTSAPAPSHRASLLSSLRTGGVRSASMAGMPHTAAPGASFNIPSRYSAAYNQQSVVEEDDQLSDLLSQNMYFNAQQRPYQFPNTATVDGSVNMFAQQQAHFTGLASGIPSPNSALGSAPLHAHAQQQALQIQLMQLELIRMQVRSRTPCHPLSQLISPLGSASPATSSRTACSESPAEWATIRSPRNGRSRNTII
jgi:hypothetical protein